MDSQKRKKLTLETKVSVIEEVEKKETKNAEICRRFDIPSSTLYTILKDKDKILSAHAGGEFTKSRKKIRRPDFAIVDQCLIRWFHQARTNSVPLSGPILIGKGEEIAKGLGLTDFVLNKSWIDRFKVRHGIVMKTVCGESSSVNKDITEEWRANHLQPILRDYRPCDIFNADETGLYYKCLPSRTLATKGEKCSGGKIPKDRITLLVAANMDGSEKLPLLTIGKFANPRCLKNVRSLPTTYKSNSKAWMTSVIFEEWLRKLDRKFLLQGRSVVLLVDNCAAHPHLTGLRAINLMFLPPNTTSILQPCDQGIIQAFKVLYRKRVLRGLIASISAHGDINSHLKLTVFDAITMAASAWDEVRGEVVANCFRHAGFVATDADDNDMPCSSAVQNENMMSASNIEVQNLFERLDGDYGTVNQYISVDSAAETKEETSSIDDIVKSIEDMPSELDEDEDEEAPIATVSCATALECVKTLRHFMMQQCNGNNVCGDMDSIEKFVHNSAIQKRKQSTITSFFKPNQAPPN